MVIMQNKASFVFSRADLDRLLGSNTVLKGEAYQQKGWVHDLQVIQEDKITSVVLGKTQARYKVRISLIPKPMQANNQLSFSIQGACSCYMNYNCKHVAATLLEVLAQKASSLDMAEEAQSTSSQMLQSRFLSSPPTAPTPTQAAAHWLSFLDTIKKQPVNPPVTPIHAVPKQELLYVWDVTTLTEGQTFLQLSLKTVNILKKGGYGAEKPYWISSSNTNVLNSEDVLIVHSIQQMRQNLKIPNSYSETQYLIAGPAARDLVSAIIKTDRAYWKKVGGPKLGLGSPLNAEFAWEFVGDGLQQLCCKLPNKMVLATQPLWYLESKIEEDRVLMGAVITQFDDETTLQLINSPPVSLAEAQLLHDKVINKEEQGIFSALPLPKVFGNEVTQGTPVPVLKLVPHRIYSIEVAQAQVSSESAMAILNFQYDETLIEAGNKARTIQYHKGDQIISLDRNLEEESEYLTFLKTLEVQEINSGVFSVKIPFMFNDLPILQSQGWMVDIDPDFPFHCVKEQEWYTEVDEPANYDWFAFELGILVEGEKINILPLLVKLISQNPELLDAQAIQDLQDDHQFHLQLPDQRYVAVLAGRIKEILSVLVELYDSTSLTNGKLKVQYVQAAQLLGLQQSLQARWMGGTQLKALGEKLLNFQGIQPCVLPKNLKGQLRDYQKEGVDWLNFLREFQLGGVLADDMGLGKTIQVLTHLLAEKESGRQKGPNLIIAPTSLMANWENECNRFTPDLKVLILQGAQRQSQFENIHSADIVLSTYPLINRDKEIFLEHNFHYLILDEAQYIKNPYTKAYQALLEVKANHTLCMTGTPMENHLGELWSLFHFAIPGLLGDNKKFKKLFRDPIEKEGDLARQKSLAMRVRPFMLRRTKEQVATELPAKTEIIHRIELTGPQLDLYEGIRLAMQEKIVMAVKEKGFMRSQILILDALLKLRQTCNDPRLLPLAKAKAIHHCAKREFLMEMLETLIEEGRKILLFSSFATMLDLIELELIEKNISYVKLTGQTKDRTTPINEFQKGDTPIMLISLKAGGVGLNLTAADTVIHYDPWWNPAAEAQATDRAHRMGQTKPVFVYKLVCKGTVEEKILKMQENKKQLLKGIFKEGDSQAPKLSVEDLAYLFEPVEDI